MTRPAPAPSLRRALLARALAGLLAAWIAVAAWVYLDASHELEELLDAHLAQAAALLVVQHSVAAPGDEAGRPDPPVLHGYGPQVAYQVL